MLEKEKRKEKLCGPGGGWGGIGRATHAHARSARCGCAESHSCRAQVQREAESRGLRSSFMSQAKKYDLLLQKEVSASVGTLASRSWKREARKAGPAAEGAGQWLPVTELHFPFM